jgi:hypothetical protein
MKTAIEMAKEAGFMLMADPDPDTGGWWECFDSEIETLVALVRADERKAQQAEHEADKIIIEYHEATIKRLEAELTCQHRWEEVPQQPIYKCAKCGMFMRIIK